MQQWKNIQASLNNLTLKCVMLNKTVADMIELKAEPSMLPFIDMALEATLIKKMTIQVAELVTELDHAGDLFEEAFTTDE